jgi:thymidylate kinase
MAQNIVLPQIKKITNPIDNNGKFDINTEVLLYCAILSEKASEILKIKGNIIVDRFSLSVYSYFLTKYNFDNALLYQIIQFSSKGIIPDMTFFLDVGLNIILERSSESPLSRKDIGIDKYYSDLRETYLNNLKLFSKYNKIINCENKSIAEIYDEINIALKG